MGSDPRTSTDTFWLQLGEPWNETQQQLILDSVANQTDGMTMYDAISLLRVARIWDPAEAFFAAALRDAIRDNFDPDLDDDDPALWATLEHPYT